MHASTWLLLCCSLSGCQSGKIGGCRISCRNRQCRSGSASRPNVATRSRRRRTTGLVEPTRSRPRWQSRSRRRSRPRRQPRTRLQVERTWPRSPRSRPRRPSAIGRADTAPYGVQHEGSRPSRSWPRSCGVRPRPAPSRLPSPCSRTLPGSGEPWFYSSS